MGRAPCCDKANVKRGPWSPEEDAKLKAFIEQNGTGGNWITLPIKAGLKRCGKSCRLRWINYLRPGIRRGGFTEDEEALIYKLHASFGSRWSLIAAQLPGRTDNDIKNYWNTRMKRKLSIKPTDFRGLQLAAIIPLSDDSARSDFQPDVVFPDKTLTMKSAPVCNQLPVEEMLQRIENSLQSCISTNSLESTCSRTSTEGTHNAAQSAISSAFPAFSNGDDRNSLEDVYPYVLPTFPLNIDHVFPKQMSFSEKVQPFQILDHINKHECLGLEDAMKQYYPSEIASKNFNVVKDEFYNVVDTAWFNPLISTMGSIMSRAWSPRFS